MYRYDDIPSPRERYPRYGRPVAERPRRTEGDRFERRLREEEDRYGPPARRPRSPYDDDDEYLVYTDNPSRRVESPPPPPRPQLLRRQSSLDTFDRMASRRRRDTYYGRPYVPSPSPRRYSPSPRRYSPPPLRYSPSPRRYESDYEGIDIADPGLYEDDEYRDIRDRERLAARRGRSDSIRYRETIVDDEVIEKPYPRKGKTRFPRRLVHYRALIELGYPFQENPEDEKVTVQKALSKDQISEVIDLSREIKRQLETHTITYYHTSPSPQRVTPPDSYYDVQPSRDALKVPSSSSRRRSHSRHHGVRTIRPRSASVTPRGRRYSSPPPAEPGPLILHSRPRDDYLDDDYDLDWRRPGDIAANRNLRTVGDDSYEEQIVELRNGRPAPSPRVLRALLKTLT